MLDLETWWDFFLEMFFERHKKYKKNKAEGHVCR